jgi:hypothetical protein
MTSAVRNTQLTLNQSERSPILLRFDYSIGSIQMPAAR